MFITVQSKSSKCKCMLDRNRFEKKGRGSAPDVTSLFYGHFIYLHTYLVYMFTGELSTQYINGSLNKTFTSYLSVEQKCM